MSSSSYRARWARNKRATDPEWRERQNAKQRTPEHQAYIRKWARNRRATDPEWRKHSNAYDRSRGPIKNAQRIARYWSDPKFREKRLARLRTPKHRARKNAARNAKRAIDPLYRERENARSREYNRNRTFEQRESKRLYMRAWKKNKRMTDPEFRQKDRKENALKNMRRRIRKNMLRDPNLQRKLAQVVLAQLEQLGFPASVLEGIAP